MDFRSHGYRKGDGEMSWSGDHLLHHVEKSRRQLGEHMWSTELGVGLKSCVGSGTEARDCMSSLRSD